MSRRAMHDRPENARTRSWVVRIATPPEQAWPILSDTQRFNQAMGIPKYQVTDEAGDDGAVRHFGRIRIGPFHIDWEEVPVDWVAGHGFHQCRLSRGPFAKTCVTMLLQSDEDGGAAVTFEMEIVPANLLGRLLAGPFMSGFRRHTENLIADINDQLANGSGPVGFSVAPQRPDATAQARLDTCVATLEAGPFGHGLAARLAHHILAAPDNEAARIRPLALARAWGIDGREMAELCIAAAHDGMLELQWDILCPRCRGAKAQPTSLATFPDGIHCSSCNIDYSGDFSRNVELTFRPAPALRSVEVGEYCLTGPGNTPHVIVQQRLAAFETRTVEADPVAGEYRLRTLEPGVEKDIDWPGGGFPEVLLDERALTTGAASAPGTLTLTNRTNREHSVVIESRAWLADALTGRRATALQVFRTLFPNEALKAGEDANIDTMTFLFTDLRGSTALYERRGDGPAYHLVRRHFEFLEDCVRTHSGCLVKTIGDAVMAAFADAGDAAAAALAVQDKIHDFNAAVAPESILLRMGLHSGPCIAVTLNGRLDYFGSTVNLTARLESESRGGDIVMSQTTALQPGVAERLDGRLIHHEKTQVKGIKGDIELVRVSAT